MKYATLIGKENSSLKQQVIDWIANNEPTIKDICEELLNSRTALYAVYDVEYHEDIQKQYKDIVLSRVCDMVCKDIGCSAELFYDTIEGTEDQWILQSLD